MNSDPFVQEYGNSLIDQLIGVGREALEMLQDARMNSDEARCVLEAITTREELTKESIGSYTLGSECDELFGQLRSLRERFDLDSKDRFLLSPNGELAVIANLIRDDSRIERTWGRLAGEGSILLLGDFRNYSTGDSSKNFNEVLDMLRDIRGFIMDTYQQIPLQRLKITLRKVGALLDLPLGSSS